MTSPRDGLVWVSNPDSGSVSVIDPAAERLIAEIAIGGEPWGIATDGQTVIVADRSGGRLVALDATAYRVLWTVAVGAEPQQVVMNASLACAYVTVLGDERVVAVDVRTGGIVWSRAVPTSPIGIAITANGRLLVSHLLAANGTSAVNGMNGMVTTLDPASGSILGTIAIAPTHDGYPNLLTSIVATANRAYVPTVRVTPFAPRAFNTTVFAAISTIDLDRSSELPTDGIALNDEDRFGVAVNNPVALAVDSARSRLYVVAAGSDLVEVLDISSPADPKLVGFLAAGTNPRGISLSADSRTAYVMSYLSRSVTILDLVQLRTVASIPVTGERLPADLLRGKVIFNNGADPRLTKRGWISCASCHPDGGHDGVTWMLADGPRRTPPIWNGDRTQPWHWSAALDEPQDVEHTIRAIQGGLGLIPGGVPDPLGATIQRRSADLDALAAYLARGIRTPSPPTATVDIVRGRVVFESSGCSACHGGPVWTSNALSGAAGTLDPAGIGQVVSALRNVGTMNPKDVRGALGFRPPSILDVAFRAPYFHDGSMPTLEAVLDSGHPQPRQNQLPSGQPWRLFVGHVSGGTAAPDADRAALLGFLRSIGPSTSPVTGQGRNSP